MKKPVIVKKPPTTKKPSPTKKPDKAKKPETVKKTKPTSKPKSIKSSVRTKKLKTTRKSSHSMKSAPVEDSETVDDSKFSSNQYLMEAEISTTAIPFDPSMSRRAAAASAIGISEMNLMYVEYAAIFVSCSLPVFLICFVFTRLRLFRYSRVF